MVIAIDGLGVNGKSTIAKRLAEKLGYKYFNTGAIYRCIALVMIENDLDIQNIDEVINKIKDIEVDFDGVKILLYGKDVTDRIRKEDISVKSTLWATNLKIKEVVRKIQKEFIKKYDTVIEGRDICTRIAPDADFKFYLYSDFETRVDRLYKMQENVDIEEIRENLKVRDDLDINGGNFIKPTDAYNIDTTNLSIEEVYGKIINVILDIKNNR